MRKDVLAGAAAVGALIGGAAIYYLREKQTEEPDYRTLATDGDYQIRDYPAMTVAETVVTGPRKRALGVVIRGETWHFEIVAGESARALMALTLDGLAIGNGILTVENEAQALVRADPAQADKGGDAARAALALLELKGRFAS